MAMTLPTSDTAAVRQAAIAQRATEYPVIGRPELENVTVTIDRNARISALGADPDVEPGASTPPDVWLPARERADAAWRQADEQRRGTAGMGQIVALGWTYLTNLVPKPFFWLWPRDLTEKLDDHYSAYTAAFTASSPLAAPTAHERWSEDLAFAEQRLSGANPMMIRRVEDADNLTGRDDDDCVIDQDHLNAVVPGITLQEAVEQKRLYICDYHALRNIADDTGTPVPIWIDGLPWGAPTVFGNRYTYAPIALFFWEGDLRSDVAANVFPGDDADDETVNGRLRPVAIQLRRGSGVTRDNVFLPLHGPTWLIARTVVQNADALMHELRYHLGWTHMCMEGFPLCAECTLHDDHPLLQLLRQHFRLHLRIQADTGALTDPQQSVEGLLSPSYANSIALLKNECEAWMFCMHAFPEKELARRGMLDAPIRYPYRDDGLRVWRAIHRFSQDFVERFYGPDAGASDPEVKIKQDGELADWITKLINVGKIRSLLPDSATTLTTRQQLADILAGIIWTSGPQHAAFNFAQWDYMAHVPNMPFAIYDRAPEAGDTPIVNSVIFFPPDFMARLQAAVMFVLGTFRYDELGFYPSDAFGGAEADDLVSSFVVDLQNAARRIGNADAQRQVPYPYLHPRNIPNATNV